MPYPQLKEMDEINPEFDRADVALVIGANDVTNPAARRPGSPVSGMPILDVDHAKSIVVIKRSMGTRLRRHRQRAVLRPEDRDAVRRREGRPGGTDRGGQGALAAAPRRLRRRRRGARQALGTTEAVLGTVLMSWSLSGASDPSPSATTIASSPACRTKSVPGLTNAWPPRLTDSSVALWSLRRSAGDGVDRLPDVLVRERDPVELGALAAGHDVGDDRRQARIERGARQQLRGDLGRDQQLVDLGPQEVRLVLAGC